MNGLKGHRTNFDVISVLNYILIRCCENIYRCVSRIEFGGFVGEIAGTMDGGGTRSGQAGTRKVTFCPEGTDRIVKKYNYKSRRIHKLQVQEHLTFK